ncbi:enoyl-CoA hydratase-related protein [Sphingomonas sp. CJ20]
MSMTAGDALADVVLVDHPAPHVLRVVLNRPQVHNAVNGTLARALEAAVDRSEADADVRVVVLAAAGERSFCAGADLSEVAAGRGRDLVTERGGFAGFVHAARTKPWIAMVNAQALGGGLELCLACDMIVASSSARFGLPEARRGIFAGAGGAFRLPRRIPRAVAMEMLATGEPIDAQRAYDLGLINRIADPDSLLDATLDLAGLIGANAPLAVVEALALARAATEADEPALWARNAETAARIAASADAREGARAFVEKRRPHWRGC